MQVSVSETDTCFFTVNQDRKTIPKSLPADKVSASILFPIHSFKSREDRAIYVKSV